MREWLKRVRLPKRPARSAVSTGLDVAGLAFLDGAAFYWCPMAGLVFTGLALLVVGMAVGDE